VTETGARKWIITATVILASVIELIDTSIVNVALPQMMGNLGATLDEVAWVITAYVVANVIIVPMTGWLSARFGRRNYFAFSVILFTVASVFCGHATNIWELVFFRFVQGIGGGALLSTSQSILVETFPREQLSLANALFGMGVVTGPTLGPVLGGWITDNLSWPWIFYVNVPIGIAATILTLTFIRNSAFERSTKIVDWWGIGLLAAGIGCLQVVLERGERDDWFNSTRICVLAAIALVSLVAFIWHELTTAEPVVDLRVFKTRALSTGVLMSFILGFGLYGSVFIFPVFAQSLLGFTPTQTGFILMPSGLATAIMMPIIGSMVQRGVPPQLMTGAGFVIFFLFCWILSHSTLSTGEGDFALPLMMRGVGLALLFIPITNMSLRSLAPKDVPQGAGLTNMMRQLGGSFGVAIMATFVGKASWAHRTALLSHVQWTSPDVQARVATLMHGFQAAGSAPTVARQQAYAAIEGTVTRQTLLLTYMEAFRIVGVFFLFCVPLLLLMRKPSRATGVPAEPAPDATAMH
jgi:DHA2 family multidrug resistance protein